MYQYLLGPEIFQRDFVLTRQACNIDDILKLGPITLNNLKTVT